MSTHALRWPTYGFFVALSPVSDLWSVQFFALLGFGQLMSPAKHTSVIWGYSDPLDMHHIFPRK